MKKIFCMMILIGIAAGLFAEEKSKERFLLLELGELGYQTYFSGNGIEQEFILSLFEINFGAKSMAAQGVFFEFTPIRAVLNIDGSFSEFSIINPKVRINLYDKFLFSLVFGINYFLIDDYFHFDKINANIGVKIGVPNYIYAQGLSIETGYEYKSNRHNYYVLVNINFLLVDPFFWNGGMLFSSQERMLGR